MTNSEPVKLKWEGPIGIGNLPTDKKTLEGMQKPGIYIFTQEYPGKLVAYAGNSKNILSRIQQHYGGYLGFTYWLRNGKGKREIGPDKGFESLNQINKKYRLAMDEAKRLRFYYAILESQEGRLVKPAESLIIRVLKDKHEAETIIEGKKFECDNARREGYRKDYPKVTFRNVFSKKQSILKSLFGKSALTGCPISD
ncbi:MAG: hypothetical protein IH999_01715 [Proteobacteria bacterium]|nr:hypothetical protein [Pseudomonadota bacterium]